jgi:hypothetical protein
MNRVKPSCVLSCSGLFRNFSAFASMLGKGMSYSFSFVVRDAFHIDSEDSLLLVNSNMEGMMEQLQGPILESNI